MERSTWEWMILPLRRYAEFNGRSCRKEFWLYWLLTLVWAVFIATFLVFSARAGGAGGPGVQLIRIATNLVNLALFIPNLAVNVRRFHDVGLSGWWIPGAGVIFSVLLFGVIALLRATGTVPTATGPNPFLFVGVGVVGVVGLLLFFLFVYLRPGTVGPNAYGDDPLNPVDVTVFD